MISIASFLDISIQFWINKFKKCYKINSVIQLHKSKIIKINEITFLIDLINKIVIKNALLQFFIKLLSE